jgi:hypothetical protein
VCAAGEALKRDENGGTSGACRCAKVVAAVMTFPTLTVETFNPASFKADVAGTLGVQPAQVVVNSVVSGSVVVDFHIQPEGVQLTFSDEVTAQVATVLANPTGLTAVYGRVVVESVLTPQQAIAASMSPPPPATPSGDATSPPPASGAFPFLLGDAQVTGDAYTSLGDAKSSLGGAESSLGDGKSSLGDAKSSLGDAQSSLGDGNSSLGDA